MGIPRSGLPLSHMFLLSLKSRGHFTLTRQNLEGTSHPHGWLLDVSSIPCSRKADVCPVTDFVPTKSSVKSLWIWGHCFLGSFCLLCVIILFVAILTWCSLFSSYYPNFLNSYSDIEVALTSRAYQMGVTGNTAALVALEESVLHSWFLSFLRPVSGSVCSWLLSGQAYMLFSLGTRKHGGCSIELISETGKEACDQFTRVARKVGKFQSSTMAETYLSWCRICARITVMVSHDMVNCVISSQMARSDNF